MMSPRKFIVCTQPQLTLFTSHEAERTLRSQTDVDPFEIEYLLEYYSLVREGKTNYISTLAFHDVTGIPRNLSTSLKVMQRLSSVSNQARRGSSILSKRHIKKAVKAHLKLCGTAAMGEDLFCSSLHSHASS